MTILKFDGKLACVWGDHSMFLSIGGRDVFAAVRAAEFSGPVTVAVGDMSFTGDTLYVDTGSPDYSEFTPGSPAEFVIGKHNIFPLLEDMDGQTVTLWIADEPFNTLDPPPVRGREGEQPPEYDDGRPAQPTPTAPRPIDVAEVAFFRKDPVDMIAAWREAAADALAQLVERGLFQLGDTLVLGGEVQPAGHFQDSGDYICAVLDSVRGVARVEVVRRVDEHHVPNSKRPATQRASSSAAREPGRPPLCLPRPVIPGTSGV